MRKSALLPCLAVVCMTTCFAAGGLKSFTGVVHDNVCKGPECATQCPVNRAPVYTLQTGGEAFVLSDRRMAARYSGRKVKITGTVNGNRLKAASISPLN